MVAVVATRKFTGDELISLVREIAKVPNKETTGTQDADILNRLNEELLTTIVPVVRRVREEYFCITRRIPLVSGTTRYRIPNRAVGQQIRGIHYWDGSNRKRMVLVSRDRLEEFNGSESSEASPFFIEGNHIVLAEAFTGSGSLEVSYLIRPGQIQLLALTRVIQSVDTATKIITVTQTIPSSWQTTTQGFDVHSPHSGAELKQIDLTRVDATGVTIEVSEAIDGTVYGSYVPAAGDYVCLAGEAALPGLPIEWHIPLAQAAVGRICEALGDVELLQEHKKSLAEMITNARGITANRVESHPKKVVLRSPLWGGSSQRWSGW